MEQLGFYTVLLGYTTGSELGLRFRRDNMVEEAVSTFALLQEGHRFQSWPFLKQKPDKLQFKFTSSNIIIHDESKLLINHYLYNTKVTEVTENYDPA